MPPESAATGLSRRSVKPNISSNSRLRSAISARVSPLRNPANLKFSAAESVRSSASSWNTTPMRRRI